MAYEEILNTAFDLQVEYNVKLLLLLLIFIYSIGVFYISTRIQSDDIFMWIIKNIFLRLPPIILLFHFPLFVIYLFRGVSFEYIYMPLVAIYGISYFIGFAMFLGLGAKYVLSLFGIEIPNIREAKRTIKFK